MQTSRENGTPPFGGHLRGPHEGVFCTPRVSGAQIHPPGGPLRLPTKGGVPFSLLACCSRRSVWQTVFTGNTPKSPKSAQNGCYPFFDHFSGSCRARVAGHGPPVADSAPKVRKFPPPLSLWAILRGIPPLWGWSVDPLSPPKHYRG